MNESDLNGHGIKINAKSTFKKKRNRTKQKKKISCNFLDVELYFYI